MSGFRRIIAGSARAPLFLLAARTGDRRGPGGARRRSARADDDGSCDEPDSGSAPARSQAGPSRHLNRRRGRLRLQRRRFSRVPLRPIAGAGSRPRDQARRQERLRWETGEAEEEAEAQGCRKADRYIRAGGHGARADSRCGRPAAANDRASRRVDKHHLAADPACAVLRDRKSDHRGRSRAPRALAAGSDLRFGSAVGFDSDRFFATTARRPRHGFERRGIGCGGIAVVCSRVYCG